MKKKILLMGNPNVGKSVIFSKLTGVHVQSSNYTGTTIDYTSGDIHINGKTNTLIDVPGTYSLSATSEAEQVALGLLEEGADVILCILDAIHLERNLDLALSLKKFNIPIIYCVNLVDVAKRQGIIIDYKKLEEYLQAPVIETVAIKNIGLRDILFKIDDILNDKSYIDKLETVEYTEKERWEKATEISENVEKTVEKKEGFIQKLEDLTLQPFPGIPIAFFVLIIALLIVVGGGKALRSVVLLPLVNKVIKPVLTNLVSLVVPHGTLRNILVGEFGIFVIGIEWPFALIMPYVFLFYIVFSFLEDSGFLPRIGVLADGVLKRIGIQGGNIIPMIMGYGCAVPAILGTRAATTYKERIIVATLVSFAIPCASQTGAFIALLGDRSILALLFVYFLSFVIMAVVGVVMNKIIPGNSQPMLLEVPNLLMPDKDAFFKKIRLRMRHFMLDAEGPMFLGIIIAAVVAETGVLDQFSVLISPLVEGFLGLPKEASLSLLLGIIRRELAVLPLLELDLNTLQLLVGSVIALLYLPCLSVFGVLAEEFSLKVALLIAIITTLSAFLLGGAINFIGSFILTII